MLHLGGVLVLQIRELRTPLLALRLQLIRGAAAGPLVSLQLHAALLQFLHRFSVSRVLLLRGLGHLRQLLVLLLNRLLQQRLISLQSLVLVQNRGPLRPGLLQLLHRLLAGFHAAQRLLQRCRARVQSLSSGFDQLRQNLRLPLRLTLRINCGSQPFILFLVVMDGSPQSIRATHNLAFQLNLGLRQLLVTTCQLLGALVQASNRCLQLAHGLCLLLAQGIDFCQLLGHPVILLLGPLKSRQVMLPLFPGHLQVLRCALHHLLDLIPLTYSHLIAGEQSLVLPILPFLEPQEVNDTTQLPPEALAVRMRQVAH
mmetsp:Transcript_3840/g.9050  ORF Transcript_3840/g.9050 Transcript_3840/m.9050 type:complete len:313 (-) Transcript_3840:342-1280(-)